MLFISVSKKLSSRSAFLYPSESGSISPSPSVCQAKK